MSAMILNTWQGSVQTLFATDAVSEGTDLITVPRQIQRTEAIGDPGVALIIDGMATLGRTTKGLLIVGPMSMPVESLAIEAPGIEITND